MPPLWLLVEHPINILRTCLVWSSAEVSILCRSRTWLLHHEYLVAQIGLDTERERATPPQIVTRALHITITMPGFLIYSPAFSLLRCTCFLVFLRLLVFSVRFYEFSGRRPVVFWFVHGPARVAGSIVPCLWAYCCRHLRVSVIIGVCHHRGPRDVLFFRIVVEVDPRRYQHRIS